MSVLSYQSLSDDEIFRLCTKQCGVITSTEDQQYYTLGCMFCTEKFLYFDAFIGHMQEHVPSNNNNEDLFAGADVGAAAATVNAAGCGNGDSNNSNSNYYNANMMNGNGVATADSCSNDTEDLNAAASLMLPHQMVSVKQEVCDTQDAPHSYASSYINDMAGNGSNCENNDDMQNSYDFYNPYKVKEEVMDEDVSMELGDTSYISEQFMQYDDYGTTATQQQEQQQSAHNNDYKDGLYYNDSSYVNATNDEVEAADDESNYDNLVEESLLGNIACSTGPLLHIKDRKQIQFLIDSYRTNRFLWDHHHPQFRDRIKRQHFLDWIIREYKRRFKMNLAKDAITRKWDNLRTVYKRECNRMSLEKTNVSTLWYFKELHFLNTLYGGKNPLPAAVEPVVNENLYRRRLTTLWNDASTMKMLSMLQNYPCFYVRANIEYRSKERRGECLQEMATALQEIMDVSAIQISKRISQLRFEYSKQKQDRLLCERRNKVFIPNFAYYEQMLFMDNDIAPFVCEYCGTVSETPRDMEAHEATHKMSGSGNAITVADDDDDAIIPYACTICSTTFLTLDAYSRHQQTHHMKKEHTRYNCDLCTASFREKHNYDEHMRRHNDELFLPALLSAPTTADGKNYGASSADIKNFNHIARAVGIGGKFVCDFPHCNKSFAARQSLHEHLKVQHTDDEYKCDICGKGFKSSKNLQNHKQIHDAVKRYICKICGSAFAQAAGLYLHKRRHNKPNERSRMNHSY